MGFFSNIFDILWVEIHAGQDYFIDSEVQSKEHCEELETNPNIQIGNNPCRNMSK